MLSRFAARHSTIAALVVVAGSLAACSGAAVAESTPAVSKTPSAPVAVTVPCDAFDTASIQTEDVRATVGQQIVVTVCSNASTGFSWQAAAVPADIVKLVDQAAAAPSTEAAQPLVGAPGTETLTFEASASGAGDIGLEYSQPWSGGTKGAWRLTLHLVVA